MPRQADSGFVQAVSAWRRAVGAANVHLDRAALDGAGTATYAIDHGVLAIVRPRTRDEVRACMGVASAHEIAVYPISRGKNWGYGSRVPTRAASVLLDLSRMTRIVAVDRVRGSVTVQPGVTAAALFGHLREHAPGWAAALPTATTTSASVVGNALDGGMTAGPYGDRFAHVYSLEVVLATGEVIRTGLDRFAGGEQLGKTEARVGPSLRNLFAQASFGIVTEMTIGLFPLPKDLRRIRVPLGSTDDVGRFLARILPLMVERVLPDPIGIFNDYESFSVTLPYPWTWTYGRTPLPTRVLEQLRDALERKRWLAVGEIASSDRAIGAAREDVVRRALDGFDVAITDVTENRDTYYAPNGQGMFGLYWRKPGGAVTDADPNRDRCGLIWCDFVMASDPDLLARVLPRVEQVVRACGFEPAVEVHTVWPRATYLVVSLAYDRDVHGEDDRADGCDRALTAYLARFDILPARRRVGSMDLLPPTVDDSASVFERIRTALDPSHLLAPGRYDGSARTPSRVREARAKHRALPQIERANLAVLERAPKRGALPGPLRPLFVERSQYAIVQQAASRILPLLLAVLPRLARTETWRRRLGLDATVAEALVAQLPSSPVVGLLSGAFDQEGRYRVFGFESSLVGVAESKRLDTMSALPGWRSLLSNTTIGRHVTLIRTRDSEAHVATVRRLASHATILTPDQLDTRATAGPVLALGWRELLAKRGGRVALETLRTNAPADILLASLAAYVVLHEDADRGRLDAATRAMVEEHLPWTAVLEESSPRLLARVLADKAGWVLRPLYRRAEAAAWFGEYVTEADWKRLVKRTARDRHPWVAQKRCRTAHEVFPLRREGGEVEFEGCFVGMDTLVVDRVRPGLVARIAERPRVGPGGTDTYPVAALVGPRKA